MPEAPSSDRAEPARVVIVGGGVAGLEAALALRVLAGDRLDLTLVAPDGELAYRPLSVAEPFKPGSVRHYPLADVLAGREVTIVDAVLRSVDAEHKLLQLEGGAALDYDWLLIAFGAERDAALPDALTFVDQRNAPGYRALLDDIAAGEVTSVAFVVPDGMIWPFPLYELALMTAEFARDRGVEADFSLMTPGTTPLSLFGPQASEAMEAMLAERGITVYGGQSVRRAEPGRLLLEPDVGVVPADRVVALPRLTGPRVAGLPHDPAGFIPVDDHGKIEGLDGVYAAGDCTTFPIKQGGLAAQQADAAAAAIAAAAGAPVDPEPFRPILRGMLLTGRDPEFLRRTITADSSAGGDLAASALWWPPTKIAGRYLAPALGVLDDLDEVGADVDGIRVDVALTSELLDLAASKAVPLDGGDRVSGP